MKKIIKKYGRTKIISFSKEDTEAYDLKIGDIVEVNKIANLSKKVLIDFKNKQEVDFNKLNKIINQEIQDESQKEKLNGTSV